MRKTILVLLFMSILTFSNAQKPIDLSVALSPALSENNYADGFGWLLGVGVQRALWKDRLRGHPNITYGRYSTTLLLASDIVSSKYNSLSLKYDLNLDLIKIKRFSLLIGAGLGMNWSTGWVGERSDRFNDYNTFYSLMGGFRIVPKNDFTGEIILLNLAIDSGEYDYFFEVAFLQFRVFLPIRKGSD